MGGRILIFGHLPTRLGHQLSIQPRFTGEAQAVVDVWITHVMPHVVRRGGMEVESVE